jgi:BirA family biotin operon repressor/biotin-[acetyl-CoA-carboxylase] ligase
METIPIRNPFPGASCFHLESVDSTQDEARRLAAAGCPPGSLVATEVQRAGRGRFPGRSWESEAGQNLLFTVYLGFGAARAGPGGPPPGLPIRIGLALREAVSSYATALGSAFPSPPLLKWPNDLLIGDRKAAGILCESGGLGVFSGVGLNCNQTRFPPELRGRATSLAIELGRRTDRWAILELFLERLERALKDGLWSRAANDCLWRRGETVAFLPGLAARRGEEPVVGTLEGIDGEGSVLIRSAGEASARAYAAGELTAGPPAYRVVP